MSAAVAVSAGIFAYLNSESRSDDMFSANVEALADNEYEYSDGYPFTTICGVAISNSRRCWHHVHTLVKSPVLTGF